MVLLLLASQRSMQHGDMNIALLFPSVRKNALNRSLLLHDPMPARQKGRRAIRNGCLCGTEVANGTLCLKLDCENIVQYIEIGAALLCWNIIRSQAKPQNERMKGKIEKWQCVCVCLSYVLKRKEKNSQQCGSNCVSGNNERKSIRPQTAMERGAQTIV